MKAYDSTGKEIYAVTGSGRPACGRGCHSLISAGVCNWLVSLWSGT